jgi:hypothetical protein
MSNKNNKVTPKNVSNYNKAIALSNKLSKTPDMSKAEITRQTYPFFKDEHREVIAKAFVEGTGLTSIDTTEYFR